MAPPKFADLNKTVADLFKDDFGYGAAKVTVKAKAADGVSFKLDQARTTKDGTVSSTLEVKGTDPHTGINFKDTIDFGKNSLAWEASLADKPLKGHKFTAKGNFATAGGFSGLKLVHEVASGHLLAENTVSPSEVTSAAVVSHGCINAGFSATFNTKNFGLTKHALALNVGQGPFKFFASLTDGKDVNGSIHHKSSPTLQTGIDFKWGLTGGDTSFNFVAKQELEGGSFVKATFDKNFLVGFGYTQKLRNEVALTLSAKVDTANLSADRHQLGAILTFDL